MKCSVSLTFLDSLLGRLQIGHWWLGSLHTTNKANNCAPWWNTYIIKCWTKLVFTVAPLASLSLLLGSFCAFILDSVVDCRWRSSSCYVEQEMCNVVAKRGKCSAKSRNLSNMEVAVYMYIKTKGAFVQSGHSSCDLWNPQGLFLRGEFPPY